MSPATARALRWGAALLLALVVARCAWIGDDAFITLRTVDHLLSGHGLRFNVAERVQAYTHPLWMLLLVPVHALTDDPFHGPLALSLAITAGVAGVSGWSLGPSPSRGAALLVTLGCSKAFVDFSTSGLENPLTHLLLAVLVLAVVRGAPPAAVGGLAGLMMVNRLDSVLLVAPLVAWFAASELGDPRRNPARWAALATGLIPVAVWHGFALVYYGTPLPNTAAAKLGHGLTVAERLPGSLAWAWWALSVDPASVLAILGATAVGATRGTAVDRALLLGAWSQVAYVGWIGGDFMGDRFLSAPVWIAAVVLARAAPRPWLRGGLAGLCLIALASPHSPLRSGPAYVKAAPYGGVVDERGYYWPAMGWWSTARGAHPRHPWARKGARLRAEGRQRVLKATAGMIAYYGGPDLHLVDPLGLTDPLIARLPARFDPSPRVGHHRRRVPAGYLQAAGDPQGALADPALTAFHRSLARITQGPLWSTDRWRAIYALHTGQLGADIDRLAARYPKVPSLADGPPLQVGRRGVWVPVQASALRVGLFGDAWAARWVDAEAALLGRQRLDAGDHELTAPEGAVRLYLFPPEDGDGSHRLLQAQP